MTYMRAAVLEGAGNIALQDINRPEVAADDVLIHVISCGICGSDIHSFKTGMYVEAGQVMGHEFVGRVAELGPNVTGLQVGDRVTGFSAGFCGECAACRAGNFILCSKLFQNSTGYGLPGAFAEYVKIENAEVGANVHLVPDSIDDTAAAMIEPMSIGVSAAESAGVKQGDTVVVLGCGIIGNACIQAARAAGAARVLGIDVSPLRLDLARRGGAEAVFDASSGDALAWVIEQLGPAPYHYHVGGNVDVVFEAAGMPQTIQQSLEMVRPGGTICIVGLPEAPAPIDTTKIVHKMPTIIGSLGGDFVKTIEKMAAGEIDPRPLATHRYSLEEAPAAFAKQLQVTESMKVMIAP
jgi:threonine dehydrogenase-like Zn-dependent dehydrogenase